jgi:uncharacterized protein (TIRG00374 family)
MHKWIQKMMIALVLAVAVYAAMSLYADMDRLWASLGGFGMYAFFAACGLTFFNYGLRFVKWHYYLRVLGVEIKVLRSLAVFLSGFVMSVTPGKFGEVFKAYLLRCSDNVSMTKTAPVVVAERLTDLLAILVLTLVGVTAFSSARLLVLVGFVIVVAMVVVFSSKRLSLGMLHLAGRLPFLKRFSDKMENLYFSMSALVRPWPLFWGGLLSVAAWLCEGVGFYLILNGFEQTRASLGLAVFIYSFCTAAGALSFLPGGLGVTEGGLIAWIVETVEGASRSVAVAATVLIRLATLWLAVVVGFLSLALVHRKVGISLNKIDEKLSAQDLGSADCAAGDLSTKTSQGEKQDHQTGHE